MALDFSPLHVEPSHYRALCLEQVGRYYWQNTEDYFWSKIIVELPEEPDRFTYGDELHTFPESAPPAQRDDGHGGDSGGQRRHGAAALRW